MVTANDNLLKAVQARGSREPFGYGIATADRYLRELAECAGDEACKVALSGSLKQDVAWEAELKRASSRLVYAHERMEVEAEKTSGFKEYLKELNLDVGVPKHTLLMFTNIVTHRQKDRDRDVLETEGAIVDPKMSLLWQHIRHAPIGKMLAVVEHTEEQLKVVSVITDLNELAHDAAKLVEAGALRISHGFNPLEYEALERERGEDWTGYRISKFEILEESLVSVPSNTKAEVLEVIRAGKGFKSAFVKQWSKALNEQAPTAANIPVELVDASGRPVSLQLVASREAPQQETRSKEAAKDGRCACGQGREAAREFSKSVVTYRSTPTAPADRDWDGDRAARSIAEWARGEDDLDLENNAEHRNRYRQGFAFVRDDGTALGDYLLPHHEVLDGELKVVLQGCRAAAAAINGARGGVDLSDDDRRGAFNHIARHIEEDFEEEAPEFQAETEPEGGKMPDDQKQNLEAACDFMHKADEMVRMVIDAGDQEASSVARRIKAQSKMSGLLEGSWEWIESMLARSVDEFLEGTSVDLGEDDFAYLLATFADHGIVCIYRDEGEDEYYRIGWKLDGNTPAWEGEPVRVNVETTVSDMGASEASAPAALTKGLGRGDINGVRAATKGLDGAPVTKAGEAERWNRQLSKAFDVRNERLEASKLEYEWVSRHLKCEVKDLFQNSTTVPMTQMGNFLNALKETTSHDTFVQTRNITSGGREEPPVHEVIRLNSEKSDDFLVEGLSFYRSERGDFVVKLVPCYRGLRVTVYTSLEDKGANRKLFDDTWAYAKEHNFLKGEAFSLGGEFLPRGKESWDDVFLPEVNKAALKRRMRLVAEQGKEASNCGVLMMGPPGTGKTLSGRVIKDSTDATFIWVSARDFGYIGGFRGIGYAFDLARELAPCVLFVEDVDHFLSDHSVDLLKTEMDGIGRYSGVVTMLTTNYPEMLPDALVDRPGRFHDVLKFDLPDEGIRRQMFNAWLDVNEESLAKAVEGTKGYSGAHVHDICAFAKTLAGEGEADLDAALVKALEKTEAQRQLVDQVSSGGLRYDRRRREAPGGAKSAGNENSLRQAIWAALKSGEIEAEGIEFVRSQQPDGSEYVRLEAREDAVSVNLAAGKLYRSVDEDPERIRKIKQNLEQLLELHQREEAAQQAAREDQELMRELEAAL